MTTDLQKRTDYMRDYMRARRGGLKRPQKAVKQASEGQEAVNKASLVEGDERVNSSAGIVVDGDGYRRGDEFQMFGVLCKDCRHKSEVEWCESLRHPTFDRSGHLIKRVA